MPNLENEKEERPSAEGTEKPNATDLVADFAATVADKAQAVADGTLTPTAFAEECIATLESVKQADDMGEGADAMRSIAGGDAKLNGLSLPSEGAL